MTPYIIIVLIIILAVILFFLLRKKKPKEETSIEGTISAETLPEIPTEPSLGASPETPAAVEKEPEEKPEEERPEA